MKEERILLSETELSAACVLASALEKPVSADLCPFADKP
jgi:hypothetical protein